MGSILIRAVDKPKGNGNDAFTEIKLRKESWFSKKNIYSVYAIVDISHHIAKPLDGCRLG